MSNKAAQENKFMTEALEDLQESTSRLEVENHALKMGTGASVAGRAGANGSGSSAKVGPSRFFLIV